MATNGEDPKQLRQAIEESYNLNELRGLAYDLEIDFEQLAQGGAAEKTTIVVSIIDTAKRRGKLEQLEQLVQKAVLAKAPNDPDETPPYQGLNYFDVSDTGRYFGLGPAHHQPHQPDHVRTAQFHHGRWRIQ